MKTKNSIFNFLWLVIPVMAITIFTSCGDDEEPMGGNDTPIASFQLAVNPDNPLEVTFTNFSQNATTFAWDFGDGNSSADKDPVHTYAAAGDYVITLTASNAAGQSAQRSENVSITDPNVQLGILAGSDSKTWYLLREGISLGIGPDLGATDWWSFGGVTPLAERPCILDDSYTFHRDGTFEMNTNGTIFVDAVANGGWIINGEDAEGCRDESEGGVWGDNPDREAFGDGGDYTFVYDNNANMLTLEGLGAYIGLCNKTSDGDNSVPIQSKTYEVFGLNDGDVADTLNLAIVGDGFVWNFFLVSYDNPADLPEIPTDIPVFGEDYPDISPMGMGHTFAADGAGDLLDTIQSASTVEFGVDDPADPTAAKVGQYNRTTELFQELQLQTSPMKNDINFENLSTVSLDVYLPSSNDYSGTLTKNVIIGIGDKGATAQWWTDHYEFVNDGSTLPEDEWITLTYSLDMHNAGSGAGTIYERNDLDMIYIGIGSGNHDATGTFYIRNLRFE
ncbi:MAG: PKD domain-containing protein [Saprospiraceae bacterium]|nr:PKD domain-containing protein [Saprospiraceae bacterium]